MHRNQCILPAVSSGCNPSQIELNIRRFRTHGQVCRISWSISILSTICHPFSFERCLRIVKGFCRRALMIGHRMLYVLCMTRFLTLNNSFLSSVLTTGATVVLSTTKDRSVVMVKGSLGGYILLTRLSALSIEALAISHTLDEGLCLDNRHV